nr:MAG TPA: hypothetical protein [Caudoviricetes sp.]
MMKCKRLHSAARPSVHNLFTFVNDYTVPPQVHNLFTFVNDYACLCILHNFKEKNCAIFYLTIKELYDII